MLNKQGCNKQLLWNSGSNRGLSQATRDVWLPTPGPPGSCSLPPSLVSFSELPPHLATLTFHWNFAASVFLPGEILWVSGSFLSFWFLLSTASSGAFPDHLPHPGSLCHQAQFSFPPSLHPALCLSPQHRGRWGSGPMRFGNTILKHLSPLSRCSCSQLSSPK